MFDLDFDMADVKPSVPNFLIVGTMALLFILLGKWVFSHWDVPVLKDVFNAA